MTSYSKILNFKNGHYNQILKKCLPQNFVLITLPFVFFYFSFDWFAPGIPTLNGKPCGKNSVHNFSYDHRKVSLLFLNAVKIFWRTQTGGNEQYESSVFDMSSKMVHLVSICQFRFCWDPAQFCF